MFNDVACKWHGMIEAKSLIGGVGTFVGLADHIDLLLGIAARLSEQNVGALNNWRLDTKEAVMVVYVADVILELVKDSLLSW